MIVLEESMMRINFGLTPSSSKSFLFFLGKKAKKKVKLLILLGFTSSGCVNFLFFPSVVLPERLEACRDRNDRILRRSALRRYFVVIPQIHSKGISWAGSYGVCRCFLVPGQYILVRQYFVRWCLLPRMSCCFCRPWKELYRQDRNVSDGARRFSWTLLVMEWVYRRRTRLFLRTLFLQASVP